MTPAALKIIEDVSIETGVAQSAITGTGRVSKFATRARNEVWARLYAYGYTQGKIAELWSKDVSTVWHGIATVNSPRKQSGK